MPILDIRRHAQRRSLDDQQSALSTAGIAMCEKLAKSAPKYALVVSSPLPRAKETAQRIAGRLDAVEPGLLPDLGGEAAQLFGEMRTLADWERLIVRDATARTFADEQLPVWARIVAHAGEKDRVLAVSHGGIIDLPAVLLMQLLRMPVDGPSLSYGDGISVSYAKAAPKALTILRA
ncbi:MAG: histidine phosphatase family protein [Chloroflexi bacterium]|nr:MAG: histidine phosphatase family protein [Chloroflexota bacterium]